jgi:dihydrofolate synthase/folylpolyglutamate synthase
VAVPIPQQPKSWSADAVAAAARRVGIPAEAGSDVPAALGAIGHWQLEPPPRVVITGSLYLAGEVLKDNGMLPT